MLPAALLACSLGLVAPSTLGAVIAVESGGNPMATHRNTNGTVDYGLLQVNSAWLPAFGLTPEQIMDPCINIRAGSTILAANYGAAVRLYGEGQRALQAALSAFNTGSFERGLQTYVPRFYPGMPISTAWSPPATASSPQQHRPSIYEADKNVLWGSDGN